MKITVYTIKDCAFSKQEKEYLNVNKLSFEEKDLETNKDFLTEMLAISNNFAGTPVTRVEKDDGTIAVLKGFTKEEFDTTFGLAASPTTPTTAPSTEPGQVNDTPIATEMLPKVEDLKPATEVVPPAETTPPAPVPTDAPVPPKTDLTDLTDSTVTPDPLKSVMDDLQSKSEPSIVPPVADQPISEPIKPITTDLTDPTASITPPADSPTIPDFPAK